MKTEEIRKPTKKEWPQISAISGQSGYMDYISEIGEKYLDSGDTYVYDRGGIQGFLKAQSMPDNSVYLSGLRVSPASRRQGIAERLTTFVISLEEKKRKNRARILVQPENNASLSLSHKLGFKEREQFFFFQGSVNISDFKGTHDWPERIIDLGFEYSLPVNNFAVSLFMKGQSLVSVSRGNSLWKNSTFTILGKGSLSFEESDSLITVPKDFMPYVSGELVPIIGFETAILLEKTLI